MSRLQLFVTTCFTRRDTVSAKATGFNRLRDGTGLFARTFHASGRCPYWCRRVSTRRCFANLIENAVKYGQRADVSLEAGPNEVVIRIEDRGPGITDEFHEQVFRPFFRLETSRSRHSGGSGLGLTVARAHGGDVRLSGRPGGGLIAAVTLPVPVGKSDTNVVMVQAAEDGRESECLNASLATVAILGRLKAGWNKSAALPKSHRSVGLATGVVSGPAFPF